MLRRENLYALMEGNFDYLLVVDDQEQILYVNRPFRKLYFQKKTVLKNKYLKDVLSTASLSTFRSAMNQARKHVRTIAVYTPATEKARSIPLKAGYANTESGEVFLFFGNKFEGLTKQAEWEKDERIKELACLYEVAEWAEAAASIDEFFTHLPRYLSPGMLYPEEVVVYSIYQGTEYGQKPSSENCISVKLKVGKQDRGEIRVGYFDNEKEMLPEEQKMLDEIGRTFVLALERMELSEKINLMQAENADYNRRLEELQSEIDSRNKDLETQKNNLSIVNSCLDRVNKGFEEAKVWLETIFKAIPDEVALIDKEYKIIMTNRENVEPGSYCYRVFFNHDRPCKACSLEQILKDKTPVVVTIKHDGRYLQVHTLPIYNRNQEVDGILSFYHDVTVEKTYNQQLRQADKLASLGQLISGIGHEINNPNQFIRGNIKIIRQSLEDMLPIVDEHYKKNPDLKVARLDYNFLRENIMKLVDDMAYGSERITKIVQGLRGFAQKDEGLLVDKIDINTLVETSTSLVRNEVHKRADIKLELAKKLPSFTGNSQKIEQVLVNLIVNASQAMRDGVRGLITITTAADDRDLVVKVRDNGAGMNERAIKQIFDPFFTTKRAKGGTGLGLAIAYRIIEEHAGEIAVTSKPAEGSEFTIRIPTQTKVPESAEGKH